MRPLLSVIIPTHNRNEWLGRAIASAVSAGMPGEVEVIVVPNGNDQGWVATKEFFRSNPNIRWLPIDEANVSAARNHGLAAARGKYVRFLDDDDYLYPRSCAYQLAVIGSESLDVVSGVIQLVSSDGKLLGKRQMLKMEDFCYAALHPSRCVQVGAHLYRRSFVSKVRWNEQRALNEDMQWLLDVATLAPLKWKVIDNVVAAWVQHDGKRLSRGSDPGKDTLRYSADMLLNAYNKLESLGELSLKRKEALADGLWSLLQKGLRYDYKYWQEVACFADRCFQGRRPPSKIHHLWPFYLVSPLMIEMFLMPLRRLYAWFKKLNAK